MKLYNFGSGAGTESKANFMHSSHAFEINGSIYWFDAGESCSRTAHLMGVDLLNVRNIFISHPDIDHIGGLPNLAFTINKLSRKQRTLPRFGDIDVYIPRMETWDGVIKLLTVTKNGDATKKWAYKMEAKQVFEGKIYEDENLKVYAVHNKHLQPYEEEGEQLSFSYKIVAEGKTIVYSGDIRGFDDLDEILKDGCDYLLMETGHHSYEDVCEYVNKMNVKNLLFVHHGRPVIANINQARLLAQNYANCNVVFCEDRGIFEL